MNLHPLFLLLRQLGAALRLLFLLVELADNDRNEQVHDEEGCHKDKHDEEKTEPWTIIFDRMQIWLALRVNGMEHDVRPRLQSTDLEESPHRRKHSIVVILWENPTRTLYLQALVQIRRVHKIA